MTSRPGRLVRRTALYARFHNWLNTENPALPNTEPCGIPQHTLIFTLYSGPQVEQHPMVFKGGPDCPPGECAESVDDIRGNCQRPPPNRTANFDKVRTHLTASTVERPSKSKLAVQQIRAHSWQLTTNMVKGFKLRDISLKEFLRLVQQHNG